MRGSLRRGLRGSLRSTLRAGLRAIDPVWVTFGAGASPDRLAITGSAGFLSDVTTFRAMVKVRFTTTPSASEVILHAGTSTATQQLRLHRTTGNIITVRMGGQQLNSSSTYTVNTSPVVEVVALLYFEAGGLASCDLYRDGVFIESLAFSVSGIGSSIALSAATELAIGAAISTFTNANTLYFRGQGNDIRLWLSSGGAAVDFVRAGTGYSLVLAADSSGTLITIDPNQGKISQAKVGDTIVLSANTAQDSRVITEINSDSTLTVNAAVTVGVADPTITGTRAVAGTGIALALAARGSDPSIAGCTPDIAFGGTQSLASWNAGENQGLLAGFGTVSLS